MRAIVAEERWEAHKETGEGTGKKEIKPLKSEEARKMTRIRNKMVPSSMAEESVG